MTVIDGVHKALLADTFITEEEHVKRRRLYLIQVLLHRAYLCVYLLRAWLSVLQGKSVLWCCLNFLDGYCDWRFLEILSDFVA